MLFFVVILGVLAAVNSAHITTVEEVNALIDKTIAEMVKEVKIPEFPKVTITGVDEFKRDGNCLNTFQSGIFHCRAISKKAQVSADKEHQAVYLTFNFEVVVDSEGHLIKYEVLGVGIEEIKDNKPVYYKSWLKRTWNKIKKAASKALHAVIIAKVTETVTHIATSIIG